MNSFPSRTILTTLFVLAIQGGHALANPIYFDYSSQLSVGSNSVAQYNYGSVYFTPTSAGGAGQAWLNSSQGTDVAGSGSITVAQLQWNIGPDPSNTGMTGTPSTFNSQSFGLALTLTDEASHAQGTLDFLGTFSGTVPDRGTLTFAQSIQTLHLGDNLYTVDLSHPIVPSSQIFSFPYNSTLTWELGPEYGGEIDLSAEVTVQPLNVQSAPEPTSLALAGLGLATILGGRLCRWRRRKQVV